MTQFRPNNFLGLPPAIKNIIILNVLVYLAQITIGRSAYFNMDDLFALHNVRSPLFKPWQIVTHLFMHSVKDIWHIVFNMFTLWMFGSILESLWGPKRFLTFYFICGIGAALLHLTFLWFDTSNLVNQYILVKQSSNPASIIDFFNQFHLTQFEGASNILNTYKNNPEDIGARVNAMTFINEFARVTLNGATIGASGAISGVLAAFIFLFPNSEIWYFITLKAKWWGAIYFGRELYFAISNASDDNVAHWAHLGGALVGFLLILTWNKKNRQNFY